MSIPFSSFLGNLFPLTGKRAGLRADGAFSQRTGSGQEPISNRTMLVLTDSPTHRLTDLPTYRLATRTAEHGRVLCRQEIAGLRLVPGTPEAMLRQIRG